MQNPPESTPLSFMLLFRNTGKEVFDPLTPDQRQELLEKWNAWFTGLLEKGEATSGEPLELETRVVTGPGGTRITDGPYPEAKEAIGGYVMLKVNSWDEAMEIAKQHPGLPHGMMIEVRQLVSSCHLGVVGKAS